MVVPVVAVTTTKAGLTELDPGGCGWINPVPIPTLTTNTIYKEEEGGEKRGQIGRHFDASTRPALVQKTILFLFSNKSTTFMNATRQQYGPHSPPLL